MKVALDTSMLLLPFTDGIDLVDGLQILFGAVEAVVPASVHEELHRLAAQGGARGRAAQGALRLVAAWPIEASELPGDDGVLDVARRLQAAVATNDGIMQREAARAGLPVVYVRGRGLALRG